MISLRENNFGIYHGFGQMGYQKAVEYGLILQHLM
jgi:hypothetical protein